MSPEEKTAVSTEEAKGEEEVVAPSTTEDETSKPDESATPEKRETPDQETGDEEVEAETEEKPKRVSGFERRVRRLNARVSAAEARGDYLQEQLAQAEGRKQPEPEPAAVGGKPKPRQEDFLLKEEDGGGPDIAAFTEALAKHTVEQELATRDAAQSKAQAQTEEKKQNREFLQREAAFADTHADYGSVTDDAHHGLLEMKEAGVPGIGAIGDVLVLHEQGPELLYYLGQNPDELQRIAKLKPQAAVMSLGGIVASLARTEEKGTEVETQTPLVSGAPKPPTPIKKPAGGKKVRPDDPDTADGMTDEEWLKARNAQVRSRA